MPYVKIYCGPCGGAGRHSENIPCTVCHGEGSILLDGPIEDYIDCPGCAGSGYRGLDSKAICGFCDGVGALKKSFFE